MDIYPKDLELKVDHQSEHATFLNLDITIKEGMFVYKLFDKRDSFPFSIVRMPHLDSNLPKNIFYSAIKGEFLRIAQSTLLLNDLILKCKELLTRMKLQGSRFFATKRSLRKVITTHPHNFQHFGIPCEGLLNILTSNHQ